MLTDAQIREIQRCIGYTFNDRRLVQAAFTHSSYVNEHEAVGNERVEFLGDCVLNFLVGERLFLRDRTASEGKLSAQRAAIVSRSPLAEIVDKLGLIKYLQVGAGVNKSAFEAKTRSDLLEAVIGAVYLDGGLDACRMILDAVYYPNVTPLRNYKGRLQNYAVSVHETVEYNTESDNGGYKSVVVVCGKKYVGSAKNKRDAEAAAAKAALEGLGIE